MTPTHSSSNGNGTVRKIVFILLGLVVMAAAALPSLAYWSLRDADARFDRLNESRAKEDARRDERLTALEISFAALQNAAVERDRNIVVTLNEIKARLPERRQR